jgi:hypothetical protein
MMSESPGVRVTHRYDESDGQARSACPRSHQRVRAGTYPRTGLGKPNNESGRKGSSGNRGNPDTSRSRTSRGCRSMKQPVRLASLVPPSSDGGSTRLR